MPRTEAGYAARIAFVVELAGHLHAYGTTAQRLEGAVMAVATELGLDCEPMSNPTGMTLSFSDPDRPPGETDTTRVIRMPPGDTDLAKLVEADRIAEEVMAGRLGIAEGHAALRALEKPPTRRGNLALVLGFGLAAAAIGGMLRLPWLDIATAGAAGLLIGLLELASRGRPQMREAGEALSALAAGFIAILVAAFVGPLNLNTVIIASLIVLVPGMTLTNAVNELTSQHLVSGTARFAGALATLMKLTVGSALALALADLVGIEPQVRALRPQPGAMEWGALVVAAFSFAVLFRARARDYPVVMLAAICGYLISRVAGELWGAPAGIFLSALLLTAAGNGYARWVRRPGAVVRVPGLLMLVPRRASQRGVMTGVQQQDTPRGPSAA
ncbi:MAG: threonine/serine ThrE exporter family protein, partial [Luteimonas sp.]